MPKRKTLKALSKRVKITATGKVKRSRPGRSHLMSSKDAKRRRHLRRKAGVSGKIGKNMRKLLA